eukprot:1624643-Prymnesium_polylepis.1
MGCASNRPHVPPQKEGEGRAVDRVAASARVRRGKLARALPIGERVLDGAALRDLPSLDQGAREAAEGRGERVGGQAVGRGHGMITHGTRAWDA